MAKTTKLTNTPDLSEKGIEEAKKAVEAMDVSRPVTLKEEIILAFDPPAYPSTAVLELKQACNTFWEQHKKKSVGYRLSIAEGDEEGRIATVSLVYVDVE